MPKRIVYTEDEVGVILYSEGVVTREETLTALDEIYTDVRFPKMKYWIIDMTTAETSNPSPEDTKQFAERNIIESRRNPGMYLALVANTDHTYAMSRIFQAYDDESQFITHVFQERNVADEWIKSNISPHLSPDSGLNSNGGNHHAQKN